MYLFYRYGFYKIPQYKSNSNGTQGQSVPLYINKLRKNGFNVSDSPTTKRYIAYHHWHNAILLNAHNIRKDGKPMKIPLKISSSIATSIDIPKSDLLSGGEAFNIPNQSEAHIGAFYDELQSEISAETSFTNIKNKTKTLKGLNNNISIKEILEEEKEMTFSVKKLVLEKVAASEKALELERQHKALLRERAAKKRRLREAISKSDILVQNRLRELQGKLTAIRKRHRSMKEKIKTLRDKYKLLLPKPRGMISVSTVMIAEAIS